MISPFHKELTSTTEVVERQFIRHQLEILSAPCNCSIHKGKGETEESQIDQILIPTQLEMSADVEFKYL